jgi:hypothetical protein
MKKQKSKNTNTLIKRTMKEIKMSEEFLIQKEKTELEYQEFNIRLRMLTDSNQLKSLFL